MSHAVKIANSTENVLKIIKDTDVENPRTSFNNIGTMISFHNRYSIGDEHNYNNNYEFMISLASEFVGSNNYLEVIEKKANELFNHKITRVNVNYVTLEYVDSVGGSNLHEFDSEEDAEEEWLQIKEDWITNDGINFLEQKELLEIIKENAVIIPLYLYDHSGITINTVGFSCSWDSGQIGWIYVTNEDVASLNLNSEKINSVLVAEVSIYDQYLRGDVYGFILETIDGREIDSCWGFYGLESIENELDNHIGSNYLELIKELKWVS